MSTTASGGTYVMATDEVADYPVATKEMMEALTEDEAQLLAERARAEPLLIDPNTFAPFKALDGIRYDLVFKEDGE